jgi:hypothetical protein
VLGIFCGGTFWSTGSGSGSVSSAAAPHDGVDMQAAYLVGTELVMMKGAPRRCAVEALAGDELGVVHFGAVVGHGAGVGGGKGAAVLGAGHGYGTGHTGGLVEEFLLISLMLGDLAELGWRNVGERNEWRNSGMAIVYAMGTCGCMGLRETAGWVSVSAIDMTSLSGR